MSAELDAFKSRVEQNLAELRAYIARMGIDYDFSQSIEPPSETEPLAELYVYLGIVQDSLKDLDDARKRQIEELDEHVRERTAELQDKVKTISRQSRAILELSTPAIQIWDGVLVVPLIGTIDTLRAQQILETLLETVVKTQATVVIIDITGVPIIDTKVANHLLEAVGATRTIGAEVIVTGVSPYNAQTLTKLKVDLSSITTKSSLQRGLKVAMDLTGNKVIRTEPANARRRG